VKSLPGIGCSGLEEVASKGKEHWVYVPFYCTLSMCVFCLWAYLPEVNLIDKSSAFAKAMAHKTRKRKNNTRTTRSTCL